MKFRKANKKRAQSFSHLSKGATKAQRHDRSGSAQWLSATGLLLFSLQAAANPQGGTVVAGQANIATTPREVTVSQSSDKAIINWQSFSIDQNEVTRFQQPSQSAVALNRVTGQDPSQILGRLSANGQVFLVNPNGIVFGSTAQVDVHGLVATTNDIANEDFMAGNYRFTIPGKPGAFIANEGSITINDSGLAAFVAPSVRNDGVILARLGKVALSAGTGFTLDLYGDELVELEVDPVTLEAVTADGVELGALVENDGEIEAQIVVLTANAARDVVDSVINMDGVIEAKGVSQQGGKIVLGAEVGNIQVAGELDASADEASAADGGEILVLGETVDVASTARLSADAGDLGGDGGFIDTSGNQVSITEGAQISAAAPQGEAGEWLIDPVNITIDQSACTGVPSCLSADAIATSLTGGTSVTVSTDVAGAEAGDITLNGDITFATPGVADVTLTLNANNDILLRGDVIADTVNLDMIFNADLDGVGGGVVSLGGVTLDGNAGVIDLSGETLTFGSGTATINSDLIVGDFNWSGGTLTGAGNLTTTGTSTLDGRFQKILEKNWNNSGTIELTDGALRFNSSTLNNSGTFNQNAAVFEPIFGQGGAVFNNGGTLNWLGEDPRSSVAFSRLFRVQFNNSGTVNVDSSLSLVQSSGTDSGDYQIADGEFLQLIPTSGFRTFQNGANILGSGEFRMGASNLSAGEVSLESGVNFANTLSLNVLSGTLNVADALSFASLSVGGNNLSSPVLNISQGFALVGSDTLTITNGTLRTDVDQTLTNLNWLGGTIAGPGTLTTTGNTVLGGSGGLLQDKNWVNAGALTISDAARLTMVNFDNATPQTVTNLLDATMTVTSTNSRILGVRFNSRGNENFDNQGALNWGDNGGSAGSREINSVDFSNSGTVNVFEPLALNLSSGTDSGTYDISAGASLRQNTGTRRLQDGGRIEGAGTFTSNGDVFFEPGSTFADALGIDMRGRTLTSDIPLDVVSLNAAAGTLVTDQLLTTGTLSISGGNVQALAGLVLESDTLDISGGSLIANSDLNLTTLNWSGGTLGGTGTLTTTGSTTMSGAGGKQLRDKNWNNAGTVNMSGAGSLVLTNIGADAQVFTNLPSGIFNSSPTTGSGGKINTNSSDSDGGEVFNNQGTLNWNTPGNRFGPSQMRDLEFNNTGLVNINESLDLLSITGESSGTFVIPEGRSLLVDRASNATLASGGRIEGQGTFISNGAVRFAEGSSIANSIDIRVGRSTLDVGIPLDIADLTVTGGTLNASQPLSTEDLSISGGSLNANAGLTVGSGTLNLSGGSLVTDSDLTFETLNWSGGTIAGTGTLFTTGVATLDGTRDKDLEDKNWINAGIVNIAGTRQLDIRLSEAGSQTFTNLASGTVNVTSTNSTPIRGNRSSTRQVRFDNQGLLNWSAQPSSASATTAFMSFIDFTNAGNVAVNENLTISSSDGTDTGVYTVAADRSLGFGSGDRIFASGSSIQGNGDFRVVSSGARVDFEEGFSFAPTLDMTITNGFLTSQVDLQFGSLDMPDGFFETDRRLSVDELAIDDGFLTSTGEFVLAADSLSIGGGGFEVNSDLELVNFELLGGSISGSGVLTTTGTTTIFVPPSNTINQIGRTPDIRNKVWNNLGTVNLSGVAYLSVLRVTGNEDGGRPPTPEELAIRSEFNNLAGGVVNVETTDFTPFRVSGGGEFNNAGTINWNSVDPDEGFSRISGTFNNTGTLNVAQNLQIRSNDGVHTGVFDVAAGQTLEFSGGTNQFDDGSVFQGEGQFTVDPTRTTRLELIGDSTGLTFAPGQSADLNAFGFAGTGVLTNQDTVTGGQGISSITLNNEGVANLGNITLAGLRNSGELNIVEEAGAPSRVSVGGAEARLESGTIDLGAGGTLEKVGGRFVWGAGSIVSSGAAGTVALTAADIQFEGTGDRVLDAPGVDFDFTDLTLPGGSLILEQGNLTFGLLNNSATVIPVGSLLQVNGGNLVNNGPLDIFGTFDLQGGDYFAGGDLFIKGGTLNIGNDFDGWSGTGNVVTSGNATLSGSTDPNNPSFISSPYSVSDILTMTGFVRFGDTVENLGIINQSGTTTFDGEVTNRGVFNLSGIAVFNSLVTNLNAMNFIGGLSTFNAGLSQLSGIADLIGGDTVGDVTVEDGDLNIDPDRTLDGSVVMNGGTLTGNGGTVTGLLRVNGGTLAPGASPGVLNVGSLELTNGSTTQIEIAGTTPGTEYDVINVAGAAVLDGTLDIVNFGGFTPTPPITLAGVINAGSLTGAFDVVNQPAGFTYEPVYGTGTANRFDLDLPVIGTGGSGGTGTGGTGTGGTGTGGTGTGGTGPDSGGGAGSGTGGTGTGGTGTGGTGTGGTGTGGTGTGGTGTGGTGTGGTGTGGTDTGGTGTGGTGTGGTGTGGTGTGGTGTGGTGTGGTGTGGTGTGVTGTGGTGTGGAGTGGTGTGGTGTGGTGTGGTGTGGTGTGGTGTGGTGTGGTGTDGVGTGGTASGTGPGGTGTGGTGGTGTDGVLADAIPSNVTDPVTTVAYTPDESTVPPSDLYTVTDRTTASAAADINAVLEAFPPGAGGSEASTSNEASPQAARSNRVTPIEAEAFDVDALLDAFPPGAGVPSVPVAFSALSEVNLARAIQVINEDGYRPTDRLAFYSGLEEGRVIRDLEAEGFDELAGFYAQTASGMSTNEGELVAILNRLNKDPELLSSYLGVYTRMRDLAMDRLLEQAVEKLRQDPDAADVFDDGVASESIEIVLKDDDIPVANGMALLEGTIQSQSKKLYLGVNGQWVFVEPDGGFKAEIPLGQGETELDMEARDHGGNAARKTVSVDSSMGGASDAAEGRRIALFISVEEYDNAIPELATPVNDAYDVAKSLAERQGFETRQLVNPTKQQIIDEMLTLSRELDEHDSLAVYYAGHGYQLEETGRGYWLPRDAETDDPGKWVSNRDVARLFHRTPARQILLISDSCYSGAFTQAERFETLAPDDVRRLRAVMALSSGGDQPVWDGGADGNSIFAAKLLQSIDDDQTKGLRLYEEVRDRVTDVAPQIPGYGTMVIPGFDNGADFVLLGL